MDASRNGQKTLMMAVLVALIAVIGTWALSWFTIAGDKVDRKEVLELIQTTAPYVLDRNVLISGMESNAKAVGNMDTELQALKIEQTRLIERVDMLLRLVREGSEEQVYQEGGSANSAR